MSEVSGGVIICAVATGLALGGAVPAAAESQSHLEAAETVDEATGKGVIQGVNK